MKEFLKYFLGAGEKEEFWNFTLAHALPILLAVVVILLTYRYRERLRTFKHEAAVRYVLAFALICSEMSYYWRLVAVPSLGPNPVDHLPITVCGWAVVFASYMVIGKSQTLFDIVYFWALAVLAVIAYASNQLIGPGANYLFMAKPEDTPSILDILPPNFVLRILVMAAAVTFLFFVAYLPWLIKDRKKAKG